MQKPEGSQLGADDFVLGIFPGRQGFFVEIGAADGVLLSNTYKLERLGWRGICIDPLLANFEGRTCVQERSVIYSQEGPVAFARCSVDPNLSGIASHLHSYRDLVAAHCGDGPAVLQAKTLASVLAAHGAPSQIEFLSVDTEGSEYEILRLFPFNTAYAVAVVAVEHNYEEPKRSLLRALLTGHGYVLAASPGWDDWYVLAGLAAAAGGEAAPPQQAQP